MHKGLTKTIWSSEYNNYYSAYAFQHDSLEHQIHNNEKNKESRYEKQRTRFLDDYWAIELALLIDTSSKLFVTLNSNYNYTKIWLNHNLISNF